MTIGIGVLASEKTKPDHLILIADTQGSFGGTYSTNRLHKLFSEPSANLYAVAADQIDRAAEMLNGIRQFLEKAPPDQGYSGILAAIHAGVDCYKRFRFRYDVLPKYACVPFSIPTDFNDSHLTPALLEEWRKFYVGCEVILGTFDKDGAAYMFTLDGCGGVESSNFPGYSSIGSGSYNAQFWLSYRNQQLGAPIKQAAYHAYEAKIMAESSSFVNDKLDFLIAKLGVHFFESNTYVAPSGMPVTLAELRKLFEHYGPQKTDDVSVRCEKFKEE